MTGRVVVVGSANLDVVLRVEDLPGPGETVLAADVRRGFGGKGANQALAAARAGAHVSMVGRVGSDADGAAYRDRLTRLGVDVAGLLETAGARTGTAYVLVDGAGENSIVVDPGANARVADGDLAPLDHASPGDVVLVQCELPPEIVVAAVRRGARAGATVVLNLAPFTELAAEVLAECTAVVVNEAEAGRLGVTADGVDLVVTSGSAGAVWGDLVEPAVAVPAEDVVDTTGAGDAFCGALAAALAAGRDRRDALAAAVAAGADAVRRVGAQADD